ncbi:discoidin domain-containing protein [Tissierella sp.]|uniref:discoidin domain-containing protein n=1 Tax=Tissierella sp. TaxID=41274 RepID=UPI00304ED506
MSKSRGEKIAVKFTEELFGNISGITLPIPYKAYRWLINSTWVSSGRLYLYELEFFSGGIKVPKNKILSMQGSSRYSTSYDVNKLFDGSVPGTEWDANGSLPHWVKIELSEELAIDKFRWYTGTSSNKPKEFILQGSYDGVNWEDIYEYESPNTNNWIEFDVVGKGNEVAFTVTGRERKHVSGELIDGDYKVYKVEPHLFEKNTIILIMNPIKRFNSVEEQLIVSYNSELGDLTGRGGKVESFEVKFIPTDLIPKLNPYLPEYIEVRNDIGVNFIKIDYRKRFVDEKITCKPNIEVNFINVTEINP